MSLLSPINRLAHRLSRWLAWFGVVVLMGGVCITTADVALRKTINFSIPGTVDITQLTVMVCAFTAIPYAFATQGHVAVAILTDRLSPAGQLVAQLLAALLSAGLMAAVTWYGYETALREWGYGDVSLTIGIPKIWYWLPLVVGSALSILVCVLAAVRHVAALFCGATTAEVPATTAITAE